MLNYSSLVTMLDKGLCCSQMIIQQGLEDTGQEDNPGLITAVSGLCKGMHSRQICGAISGSVCLLSLCAPDNISDLAKQVVEWFVSEYEGKYESINCGDILGDDEDNHKIRCPQIIMATYNKTLELLEESGFELP